MNYTLIIINVASERRAFCVFLKSGEMLESAASTACLNTQMRGYVSALKVAVCIGVFLKSLLMSTEFFKKKKKLNK